jgi:hypothetical protein
MHWKSVPLPPFEQILPMAVQLTQMVFEPQVSCDVDAGVKMQPPTPLVT